MAAFRANDSSQRRRYVFGPAPGDLLLTYGSGRWKLWSAREAAVKLSHSDSVETYTAASWGWGLSAPDGSEASEDQFAGGIVALGCASGRVQVWDPHSGELVGPVAGAFHSIQKGVDCAVSAVAAARPQRQSIFVGAQGVPDVLEIGVLDGVTRSMFKADKSGIVQLASSIFGDEWLLTMGSGATMKLWAVADTGIGGSPKPRARLAGPAEPVQCVDVAGMAGRALALSCDWTTNVDVFWVDSDAHAAAASPAEGKATRQADIVLSSHERVLAARFAQPSGKDDSTSTQTRISVIGYGAGGVSVWRFKVGNSEKSRSKATAPILVVAASEFGGRVICALAASPTLLRVAYGAGAQPTFAEVHMPAKVGAYAADDVSIVQLASSECEVRSSAMPAGEKVSSPAVAKGASGPGAAGTATRRNDGGATVLGPLEAGAGRQRPQKREAADEADDETEAKRIKLPAGGGKAQGMSLAPIVRQGLRAKGGSSLNRVLENADRSVIDNTVVELSGTEAFDLLQECTTRLLTQPINGSVLSAWAQRVLARHCAFIGSQPTLRHALVPLHDALQSRTTSYRGLIRLRGRLGMLRNLATQCESTKKEESETIRSALLEYVEGDEEAVPDDEEPSGDDAGSSDDDELGSGLDDLDILDDDDWD